MCVSVDNDLSEWTKHSIHHPEEPQGEVLSGSVLSARSYQEHHIKCKRFFFLSCFQFLQSLRLKLWMLWWRFFSRDLDLREYLQVRVRIYVFLHNPERHRTVKLILFSSVLICLCRSSEPVQPVHELQVFELIRVFYSLQQNFCLRVTEQRTLFVYGAVRVRWRQIKHLFLLQSDTSRLEWLHFFKSLLYSRCLSIGKTKSWFCIIGGEKLFHSVCCRPKKEWWCEDLCVWFVN